MGGSGTTETSGTIAPELRGLYTGSANQLLNYQQQNPLTGYAQPNVRGTAGLSPYETAGLMAMGNTFNPSQMEGLALQSVLAAPGVARQGPTTGRYGYGGLQDMQAIYNSLGGYNPLQQTRGNVGGGPQVPPSGPPFAPPQQPPAPPSWGGGGGGGGNGGPGGAGQPPIAMSMSQEFPSVAPDGNGGYNISQSMSPPSSNGSINAQALRNFVLRSWESDQRRANRPAGSNAGIGGAGVDQWATQPFRGFDQYGIARSQGLGQHEGQGLGFIDPRTGDYMTRSGNAPSQEYINQQMQSLLTSQGRSMADLDNTTRASAAMPGPAPVMSAEEAARQNAAYSRNFQQSSYAPTPPVDGANQQPTAPASSQATAPAAAPAPATSPAEQAAQLRRARAAVTVAPRR